MSKKDSEEDVIKDIKKLQNDLDIMSTHNRLAKCKCVICGEINSDIISFTHKKPAHDRCLKKM